MTAEYRIKIADLLTDGNLDEFEFTGVTAETRLGAAGALQGSIPIARGNRALGARIAAIKSSGGSAVHVYRNSVPWWDGVLWVKARACDEYGKPSVGITAGTIESYLDRVQLGTDLPAMLAADQMDIARSFIDHMKTDPYADLRITYDTTTSTRTRDRVLYLAAARPSYLRMLDELATLDDGFEYSFAALTDPVTAARTRRMRLGYPILSTGTVHRIDKPGAIISYSFPEDGTRGATYLMATGSGAQSAIHTDAAALAAGYPRLDTTTSYSSITDPAVLETHAIADLALARVPVAVPTIRIRPDTTDITPQSIGDTIKVGIRDEHFGPPLYPVGYVGTFRLVGMIVSPPERGKPETHDLVLN